MKTRAATQQDLGAIWPCLAPRMVAEYEFAEVTLNEAKTYFVDRIRSEQAIAILNDHTLIALMAWEVDNAEVVTSFAATEEFFGRKFVKSFALFLRDWRIAFEKLPILSHSYSEHPATPKWFRILGFTLEHEDGVHRIFVLKPSIAAPGDHC